MKPILLSALLLISFAVKGQSYFAQTYNEPTVFSPHTLELVLHNNNCYLVYLAVDTVAQTENVCFRAFDSIGQVVSERKYPTAPNGMIGGFGPGNTYNDDNYIYATVVAKFRDTTYATVPTTLIKFDYAGDTLWTKVIDTTNNDCITTADRIYPVSDTTLLITGYRQYKSHWGNTDTLVCLTLTKVDTAGNTIWHKQISSPTFDGVGIGYGTAFYNNTLYYLAYKGLPSSNTYFLYNTYLYALDTTGNVIDSLLIDTSIDTISPDLRYYFRVELMENNTLLAIAQNLVGQYLNKIVIQNINPDLTVNWVKTVPTPYYMLANDVLPLDTTFLLTGYVYQDENVDPNFNANAFVMEMNYAGDSLGYYEIDLSSQPFVYEYIYDLDKNDCGNIVGSYHSENLWSGTQNQFSYALVQLDTLTCGIQLRLGATAIAETVTQPFSFELFPNPATNAVTVVNGIEERVQYDVINSFGMLVESFSIIGKQPTVINTNNWADGIYYVRAQMSTGKTIAKRLICN